MSEKYVRQVCNEIDQTKSQVFNEINDFPEPERPHQRPYLRLLDKREKICKKICGVRSYFELSWVITDYSE